MKIFHLAYFYLWYTFIRRFCAYNTKTPLGEIHETNLEVFFVPNVNLRLIWSIT